MRYICSTGFISKTFTCVLVAMTANHIFAGVMDAKLQNGDGYYAIFNDTGTKAVSYSDPQRYKIQLL
eukprot:m.301932 g.301932  ORF g.301932 m.301932 type:complete len:67 (+) comp16431_c0_seq4:1626-1826(+)